VQSKGGVDKYLKAETEETIAKGIEVGSMLAAGAASFQVEVQTKGFQAAFLSTWTTLTTAITAKKEKEEGSESGFDEDTP